MRLPHEVEYIISRLESLGHRADVVGGPVRDALLGRVPDDYDITTDASPDEVKSAFADKRTVDTGIKHGTVSLILGGIQYEITTYRVDGEYKDSRHPETVTFTDKLADDLARRDFTMNAVCYNPRDGFTDPYCGIKDIRQGLIRAVGDPEKRFSEDALRILRAVRFSAVLGFSMHPDTKRAVLEKRSLLSRVSAERIYTEWKKLISGTYAYSVLREFSSVIAVFLPELEELRLPCEQMFSRADSLTRMLSAFALSCADSASEMYSSAMYRLKTDREVRETGIAVLSSLASFELEADVGLKKALMSLGADNTRALIRLELALGRIGEGREERLDELLSVNTPYRISDLAIGGEELVKLGFSGKKVGDCLRALLSMVVEDKLPNERATLLSEAQKLNKLL